MAILDKAMKRVNDHRSHIALYNGCIKDIIKNQKNGILFDKEISEFIKNSSSKDTKKIEK